MLYICIYTYIHAFFHEAVIFPLCFSYGFVNAIRTGKRPELFLENTVIYLGGFFLLKYLRTFSMPIALEICELPLSNLLHTRILLSYSRHLSHKADLKYVRLYTLRVYMSIYITHLRAHGTLYDVQFANSSEFGVRYLHKTFHATKSSITSFMCIFSFY